MCYVSGNAADHTKVTNEIKLPVVNHPIASVLSGLWSLRHLILLSNAHALHRALSNFLRLCVYVWTGKNDSNTLRVDANFFINGGKASVFKISGYVLTKRNIGVRE